jgi:hypothetical protein
MDIVRFWEQEDFDNARWKGVAFFVPKDGAPPPILGLFFENDASGRKVFEQIIARVGTVDERERIRVSIIEGDIPGEDAGYSIFIGPEREQAMEESTEAGNRYTAMLGRFHRMNPPDGKSPSLDLFKKSFAKHKEYVLIPVGGTPSAMKPHFGLAVKKHIIHFRQVADLRDKNDPDYVVLKKDVIPKPPQDFRNN